MAPQASLKRPARAPSRVSSRRLSAQAPPYPSTLCRRRCFRDCHSRKEAYDFKGARTSITDHFELLDGFLIDQLSGCKVRFLIASLTGWSREKIRKWWKQDTEMKYDTAKSWCILKFTHKEERAAISQQLRTISMKSGE